MTDRGVRRQPLALIVNRRASTVTADVERHVVEALRRGGRRVEVLGTEDRGHAPELARRAARDGIGTVACLGGDGTIGEVANGLIGSEAVLACLPGGATNVFCRLTGVPPEPVAAATRLAGLVDSQQPFLIDTGRVNGRHFLFASGAGLDGSLAARADAHPWRKSRLGPLYFAAAAVATFASEYLVDPPRLHVEAGGATVQGVTAIVQNADPLTYFGARPIRLDAAAGLATGALAVSVLRRTTPLDLLTLTPRLFAGSGLRHRHVEPLGSVTAARVTPVDGRPFALEADGEHLGEAVEAVYESAPRSLKLVGWGVGARRRAASPAPARRLSLSA